MVKLKAFGGPTPLVQFPRMPRTGELVAIHGVCYRLMAVSQKSVVLDEARCQCGAQLDVRGKCRASFHR